MTAHIRWACVCQCEQEAEGWLLSRRKDYGGKIAKVKSKMRDFFAWTDEKVEQSLKVKQVLP